MDPDNYSVDLISQDIVKYHFEVNALIQDIQQCSGPLEILNELNAEGRTKIAVLKSSIDRLTSIAETESNEKEKTELLLAVDNYKEQLSTSLTAFRKANVVSACVIDKLARENLFSMPEEQQAALRKRHSKQSLTNASSQVTDKLLSISRHLAEITQRGADTLDTLLTSSDKVGGTKDELEHQQQAIVQSGFVILYTIAVGGNVDIGTVMLFTSGCVTSCVEHRFCATYVRTLACTSEGSCNNKKDNIEIHYLCFHC